MIKGGSESKKEFENDFILDRVKTLEMKVAQLEKTIERMDMILCAVNHRQKSEMERGYGGL